MKSIMYEPRPLSLQVLELGFIDISGGNFPLLLNIAQDFVGYLGFQKYLAPPLRFDYIEKFIKTTLRPRAKGDVSLNAQIVSA
jgi:hypothetical protein